MMSLCLEKRLNGVMLGTQRLWGVKRRREWVALGEGRG